jgi:hypothetical protein
LGTSPFLPEDQPNEQIHQKMRPLPTGSGTPILYVRSAAGVLPTNCRTDGGALGVSVVTESSPDQIRSGNPLIDAYFRIVATDTYEQFAEIITPECTFSLMPTGRTFRGRESVMRLVTTSGSARSHHAQSTISIGNWFTCGDHFCVEYAHWFILRPFGRRMSIDGYCLVFHISDGKFDAVREYINPSRISVSLLTRIVLRILPFVARSRFR